MCAHHIESRFVREDTPARREGARETQSVQSLERGLAVLQVFSRENPAPTLSEVARLAEIIVRAGARNVEGPGYHEGPGYYAVFFEDPSGNRLEICHRSKGAI